MREKNENIFQETEAAFAFAMLLMNVLIFAVVAIVGWLTYSAFAQSNSLNALLRGDFLP